MLIDATKLSKEFALILIIFALKGMIPIVRYFPALLFFLEIANLIRVTGISKLNVKILNSVATV